MHVYPMKAARGVDLTAGRVEPWGLAGDRRWLLVDAGGRFISQREEPALATVTVRCQSAAGDIAVSACGHPPLAVRAPSPGAGAPLLRVTVQRATVSAAAAGPAADAWFSRFLGRGVRLVYLDDPTRRAVNPAYGAPGDRVSFADGYPLLLTTSASLGALGRWLIEDGEPAVPMSRFRPNVVIAGTVPWAEDGWRRVRIGPATFRVAKPSGRCVVTTIDQATGEQGREPLRMLGQRRRFGAELVFGQNLIPDDLGILQVGDPVEVLAEDAR
jgi:hypothetical protein